MEIIYQNNDTAGLENLYTHEVILLISTDYVKTISKAALSQLEYNLENRTNALVLSRLTQAQKDEIGQQSELKHVVQSGVTRGETSARHISQIWGELFNKRHPDTLFEVWIAEKSTEMNVRLNTTWRGKEKELFHLKIKAHFQGVRPCSVLYKGYGYEKDGTINECYCATAPGSGRDTNVPMGAMRKFTQTHTIKKFTMSEEEKVLRNFVKAYDYPQLIEHKLQPAVVPPTVRVKV